MAYRKALILNGGQTEELTSPDCTFGHMETLHLNVVANPGPVSTAMNVYSFYMPYNFTVITVQASCAVPPSAGDVIADVVVNGGSIFSSPLQIDNGTYWSEVSGIPWALATSPTTISKGDQVRVDITTGNPIAKGLKVLIVGYATGQP